MPIDLFTLRNLKIASGLAFCFVLPATSHAFTQDDQRRLCTGDVFSTLRVGNSECGAHHRLHAQAAGQSERRLSQSFRQTIRTIGLGQVIRELFPR